MAQIEHDTGKPAPTRVAHIMYLLHGISPFTLWTLSLVAVVVGAINRDTVRGTWVETHYAYLLSTFLWGIFWLVLLTIGFTVTVIGFFLLFIPWTILTVWYLYRVIRGWLRLNDGRPAPE